MRLNETRNVLWHESCKCVCKLNSSVCNNKQIWNSDTCRCDCNEDLAGIISCDKGYTWNPSTSECQCDMWCKAGQYLDPKNCICKNKLIGRVTEECTSIINETMRNNKVNIDNNNTITYVFIGLFSVLLFVDFYLLISSGLKLRNYSKIDILIIKNYEINYKMCIEPLQIKNKYYYLWDDIIYIYDFDIGLVKIFKRESKIGINSYYNGYKPDCDDVITPLYLFINRLFGFIQQIEGSSDRYLVVSINNEITINIF